MKKILTVLKNPIISSLIASAIWTVIDKFVLRYFVSLELTVSLSENNKFTINILTVIFIIVVVFVLLLYFIKKTTIKGIREKLPNDDFCSKCEKVSNLNNELQESSTSLERLKNQFQELLPCKDIKDVLKDYFDSNDVVESILLFSCPTLPSIEELSSEKRNVSIPVCFIDGIVKREVNINALYNITYVIDSSTYYDIKSLFDIRNTYYSNITKNKNYKTEELIQDKAQNAYNKIEKILNAISSLEEISEEHYLYYRLLVLLSNIIFGENSIVECKNLLQSVEIEKELKIGQKTELLGTIFTDKLYCFCNAGSHIKKNRIYFSFPILYKDKRIIVLCVSNKEKLRTNKSFNEKQCCEKIYDDIKNELLKLGDKSK